MPFLFNLWERDERFWKIDSNPVIAGHGAAAARLEGGRPDGGRRDRQEAGGRRQARLAPGLRLLADRHARRGHVLDRARRRRRRERRDDGRAGLAQARREAPGRVRRRQLVHARRAPGHRRGADARGGRPRGRRLPAEGRRVRLPPRADLARVGPEHEPEPAPRLRPALRRRRDDVARRAALPLQLHATRSSSARPASRSTARTSRRIETAF